MTQLLRFCQDEEAPWWHGAFWAVGMAVSEMIRILLFGASWGVSYRYICLVQILVCAFTYRSSCRNYSERASG
jgi:ATP-binding cassette subfamily C (CFTR/MRP) protein 5